MSSGEAFTGVEKRCDPTTWMMSPDVMYFLAVATLAREVLARDIGLERHGRHFGRHHHRTVQAGLFQQRNQPFDFANGILVGVRRAGAFLDDRVDHDGDGLGHAVKDEQFIGNEEIHHRRFQFVVRRARHHRLDVMDEFVTDEPDRPAGEARQPGSDTAPVLLHHALDHLQPVKGVAARLPT
jgi:hypothetical protein